MPRPFRLIITLLFLALQARADIQLKDAVKARIEKGYATVLFADGHKTVVPMQSLSETEVERLTTLSTEHPLAHGKSEVIVAKEPAKKTIVTATTKGPLETVQLCPPSVPRNQIGGTCMLYGRVHWLDIAGYYADNGMIYRVSNVADAEHPWQDMHYLMGLDNLVNGFLPKPIVHDLALQEDPFEWARAELRKGRPILAAFPKEIWQALPPGFVAAHPWGGGSVGHQIVINGFTWNSETKQGTFHIVNSWNELPEFDLKTEYAKRGVLVIEQSLSPKGEPQPEQEKEIVKSITLIRNAGKTNLYEVETNLGKRRIAATDEDAVRSLVEDGR